MGAIVTLPENTRVVLLSGKQMAGKSTQASHIQEEFSLWRNVALADELKDDVCRLCGVTRDFLDAHKDLFRPILQQYGTNIMRYLYGEDYWVKRCKERIMHRTYGGATIDDVRFPSELFGFGECSPYTVRLNISLDEQVRRYEAKFRKSPDMSIFYHESETALDEVPDEVWDCIVQVDGLTSLQVRDAIFASMRRDNFPLNPFSPLTPDSTSSIIIS